MFAPTAKGRTTTELRESFVLAEGVSQTRTAFRSKTPDPFSKKRLSEGYASSNSSGIKIQATKKKISTHCTTLQYQSDNQICFWEKTQPITCTNIFIVKKNSVVTSREMFFL